MDGIDRQPTERKNERIRRAMREDGIAQPLEWLHLARLSSPRGPIYGVMVPSLCVIAQGSKEVLLGESRYRYDPFQYLLATVEVPRVSKVLEVSRERPYPEFWFRFWTV